MDPACIFSSILQACLYSIPPILRDFVYSDTLQKSVEYRLVSLSAEIPACCKTVIYNDLSSCLHIPTGPGITAGLLQQ